MSDNPERPVAGDMPEQKPAPQLDQQAEPSNEPGPAPNAAAAETPDAALLERMAALEAERDEFKDRWMRSEAEMANIRTRARREVEDARQYAVQKFARDVAESADNLRRGLDSVPSASSGDPDLLVKLRDGFEGVERSFLSMLERHGVIRVDPTHQPFDPNLHQAMSEQPSAEHPPGTVLQAWTAAWTLNGRLLRPAMVVVAAADGGAGNASPKPVDIKA